MAKKIFRLHEGGTTEQTGWFKSAIITSDDLKTIKTDGKGVATSIPTPFATIDLVKSAFRWVAENGIKGNSAHHKLVSDALDVAQLFYVSPKFEKDIRIIAWNPRDRLRGLIENGNKIHRKYAGTLRLFWRQDSVKKEEIKNEVLYNFEYTDKLYFILNKETNNVIGGTSPATLFFASPDVRKVTDGLEITIGQDKLFDNEYAALPERELSFIEYIYTLSKHPRFARLFPEVYEYLDKIRHNRYLARELNTRITDLDFKNLDTYSPCTVLENENDTCKIFGITLGVQPLDTSHISSESDFVIKSDFSCENANPLVLPQYPFSGKWTYTTEGIMWDEKTKIPYKNTDSPENSKLPVQHDPYFWLTAGNFFEDTIIELPYPIDDSKFETCGSKNHLLPLSATFFKYFEAEKVSKLLTITERAGGNVDCRLTIPVKKGNIILNKQYSIADKNTEQLDVHLAIFPFLKAKNFDIKYNIGLLDNDPKDGELLLSSFVSGQKISLSSPIIRNPGEGGEVLSKYYKSDSQMDSIRIYRGEIGGFTVPILKECSGNAKLKFAVDFGTTNTHIEYKYEENDAIPLDNSPNDLLWHSLLNRKAVEDKDPEKIETESTFEQEILPFTFSSNKSESSDKSELSFPLRTALVHNKNVDFGEKVEMISQVNNYCLLETRKVPSYLKLCTQLKWGNHADTANETRVKCYIEFLTTLVYYKTIQRGGNPSDTTITWFYPVSMAEGELGVFRRLWKTVYNQVFNQTSDKGLKGIPESVAPYLYYKSSVVGLSLSIDVGGGSSDIAVFDEDDGKAKLISSFKFAGNAIFGDGYPSEYEGNSDSNGFVKTFRSAGMDAVKNDPEKKEILDQILGEGKRKNSADFSSYLFALEREASSNFSYTRLLEKDNKLKLSILVFYGAIAYYSANLLKKAGINIPKNILLSGTASQSAPIIDTSEDLTNLSSMFQFIFERVYKVEAEKRLRIELAPIPKEITCKGALKANIDDSIKESPIKFWIGGTQDNGWGNVLDREKDVQNTPKYGDLKPEQVDEIGKTIQNYYSILDEYIQTIRIESKYSIEPSAYKIFKELRKDDIKHFLGRGIKAYRKEADAKIEESLFFYPLIGILHKLSCALAS